MAEGADRRETGQHIALTDQSTGQSAEPATSLSDLLTGDTRHEAHQEAGSQQEPASAAPPAPAPAAETPTPPPAASAAPPATPAAQPATPDPAAAPETQQPFWYRQALKKEKERQRELERQIAELQANRQQAEPEPAPDPYADPQGYNDLVQQHLRTLEHRQNVAISERFARLKHGDSTWEETHEWLETRPDMVAWARQQPDPCESAIQAFKREKLAAEIGDDPAKWRETERQRMLQDPEIRAQILAELGATPAPQTPNTPQQPQRAAPPPPASDTRSAAPRGGDQSFAGPTPMSNLLHTFK